MMDFHTHSNMLIPSIVDRKGAIMPDAVYAEYPNSTLDYSKGYQSITYKELARAMNNVAAFLLAKLGPGDFETLPYIGPNDVRYPALILGAAKAGYVVRSMSHTPSSV